LSLHTLVNKVKSLKENRRIRRKVKERIEKFEKLPPDMWFSELCFCILTANSSAEVGIKAQKELRLNGFLSMSKEDTARELRRLGHPYPERRAEYIVEAREHKDIYKKISSFKDERVARDWLVRNIKGIGYKEASHFLRNVGFKNVAIIDRHILKVMVKHGLIEKTPKTLTRKKYLELEEKLKEVAEETGLSLAELDLYLWYMETGRILK